MKPHFLRRLALFYTAALILSPTLLPNESGQAAESRDTTQALAGIKVRPSATDPRITTFDTPHLVFVNPAIVVDRDPKLPADRHELLLFLPGTQPGKTGGKEPQNPNRPLFRVAATLGYHVIVLRYPNDRPASVCGKEKDRDAFEKFRMTIIAGGESKLITVARADSIENRLIKLLSYLDKQRPAEKWGQFLRANGGIKWQSIAVAGHSQGGGHAALIAVHHRVARVICTGSPKDYSRALKGPAAWYAKKSATPSNRFFAFNHRQDDRSASMEEVLENLRALGVLKHKPPADVDRLLPPYEHSHVLTTNYPGTQVDSKTAHGSVLHADNEKVFGKVWEYLLTEPAR